MRYKYLTKDMNKKISLIIVSAFMLLACSNNSGKKVKPVKPNEDYKGSTVIETNTDNNNIERGKREKITLENTVFSRVIFSLFPLSILVLLVFSSTTVPIL